MLDALLMKNEQWYELLVETYINEVSEKETAKNYGMNPSAVYSKIYRAKNWLRSQFKKEYDEIE